MKSTKKPLQTIARSMTLLVAAWCGAESAHAVPRTRPAQEMITVRRVKDPDATEKKSIWFSEYFVEFTGPSADFSLPLESYSTSADYYSPMALFQSLELEAQVSTNNRVGLLVSANKPLQNEVLDRNYNYYSSEFTIFDPTLYLQANNLLSNSFSWVNTKLSVDLPMSEFSKQAQKITTIYLGPTWNFRLPNPKWYTSFNLDMYYNMFKNQAGWTRFTAGVGHSLGYYFSPKWHVDTTSYFDFGLISQGDRAYTFTTGTVDRLRVTLRFQPVINKIQFGVFAISPIYDRGLDRTALGVNSNIWF